METRVFLPQRLLRPVPREDAEPEALRQAERLRKISRRPERKLRLQAETLRQDVELGTVRREPALSGTARKKGHRTPALPETVRAGVPRVREAVLPGAPRTDPPAARAAGL